jgi:ribosome biogenesis GTPase
MGSPLDAYGLDAHWRGQAAAAGAAFDRIARVSGEHGRALEVVTSMGRTRADLRGALRHEIRAGLRERPAVGDFILLDEAPSGGSARLVVDRLLDRKTVIARRAPGRPNERQVLAANVDLALLVCALGPDVNPRRIERLAALAWSGGVEPVVVLNKCDLCPEPAPYLAEARAAAPGARSFVVSARHGDGLEALAPLLAPARTVVLLGSSGAGKSSLVNRWIGAEQQRTSPMRRDGRGRHTTTSRQMLVTASGALVIDTPGLREVGLCADAGGLERAFPDIVALGERCRFADCAHRDEPGCAVRAAVAEALLAPERLAAWHRLRSERDGNDSAPTDG